MNRCDRRSASSADCTTATEKGAQDKPTSSGGGARPRARQQPAPKIGNGKTWTSNTKRNGEGKLAKCSVASAAAPSPARNDKSGAFDSLLKRAQRRRSSGNSSEKAASKQGARGDDGDDTSRQAELDDVNDKSRKPKEPAETEAVHEEDDRQDSPRYDSGESKRPAADAVEYTILARPERQRAAAEVQIPPPPQGTICEEENVPLPLRDTQTPSREFRFKERIRRFPVGTYADAAGVYTPHLPGPSQERGFFMPDCRRPTFAPASRSAPGCIADELNCLKLAEAPVHPGLHYPEAYPVPPPPSPLVPPSVAPPFPGLGYFADRLGVSRRRTRSYPRRLPERRLYDAHGRWIGQERRSLQDFDEEGWSLSLQHQPCRDGFCSYIGGRELRSPFDLPRGYGRRHSWSHSSVPDDDIEDLLPLIDKFAVDYANSDSSIEGTPEAVHIPDEGSWFSVLPETTRPEDRFIWSPRRDLHRPRSVWSPIKPRLGGSSQDCLRDSLTRPKYRFRTYTENAFQGSVDAIVEARRSMSCDFPYFEDNVSTSSAASSGETHCTGWSPWSSQLPTADLLNVS